MEPLFDAHAELVGWIAPAHHIFDTEMAWVAYLSEGHAWSAATRNWLGPVEGVTCFDRSGRVIAWSLSAPPGAGPAKAAAAAGGRRQAPPGLIRPMLPIRPMRPVRPMQPKKPLRPLEPLCGWSRLSWKEWLAQ